MKKIIRKMLIGNAIFNEYTSITIDENIIVERVFIKTNKNKFEVSKNHWLLSLDPMIFGIWFSGESPTFDNETIHKLLFKSHKNETIAILNLTLTNCIIEKDGNLFLFKVEKCAIFHLNEFKNRMIYEGFYKKSKNSFSQFKNLVVAFSYPRKVRLVSFKNDDYSNIFPMDLIGEIIDKNRFVFGLRHTNIALDKIIESKKIVVIEFPFFLKEEIYNLSKNHSSSPPNINSLPFEVISSKLFNFPVPIWTIDYKEIEIEKTLDLGSHMLLSGKVMNNVNINEKTTSLYHIHFINYLYHKNNKFHYPLV